MTVLIVEDEERARKSLKALLQIHCSETIEVIGEAGTVPDAVHLIQALRPELVFMDILLQGGTGFDVLSQVSGDFKLVFVTAYDEYALRAFRFSAAGYLLKPVDPEELVATIEKISREDTRLKDKQLDVIKELLHNKGRKAERIIIPTADGMEIVAIKSILYCQADRNYTHLVLQQDKKILSSKTLKYYEELLEGQDFFRAHNSYLVNLAHVRKYYKSQEGVLEMDNGYKIDVARNRKAELLHAISNLI
jgi:two-component system, LytTR family, response regulator